MLRSPAFQVGCALIAFVLAGTSPLARAQEPARDGVFRFGPFEREIGRLPDGASALDRAQNGLTNPIAATIAKTGDIWVLDRFRGRLHVFNRAGETQPAPQHSLVDGLPVHAAADFALSPSEDRIALVDSSFDRVIIISAEPGERSRGATVIGSRGTKPGEFCQPSGVAWLDESTLIIADRGNDRVQIIGVDGEVKRIITGTDAEPLQRPGAVAVDHDTGRFAVVEPEANRVRVFNADGEQAASWGDWGPFPGLFDEPIDAQWHEGRLLIVDRRNHRVQSFKPDGSDPQPWGQHELVPHEGGGKLHYPDALAIAPDGSFAVIVEAIEDRVQVFKRFDPETDEEAFQVPFDKTTLTHLGEFVDTDGNLMVAVEPENHFVFIFDLEQRVPIILNRFGERGERFGLIVRPTGIDLDFENRSIMLVDPVTRRISEYRFEYDPNEPIRYHPDMTTFARSIDLAYLEKEVLGHRLTWPIDPGAMQRDGEGRVYLADKRNRCVLRFAADFSTGEVLIPGGWERGEIIIEPTDIAVSDDGETIVVVDGVMSRVQMFDGRGELSDWPKVALRPIVGRPTHVALSDDRIYVTNAAADEIIALDRAGGSEITRWGGRGADMGELWKPTDLVVDSQGRIVVIDHGNHRAQIFAPDGEWLITFGAGRAYTRETRPRPRNNED